MRVLVTGDRGYIGAVMAPFLMGTRHEVVGLDADWYDGCDFGTPTDTYERRTGDIRDTTADALADFDAVTHLAAISNDPLGQLNPAAIYSVKADGAIHMARVAKKAGVRRFLSSSSCSLYGAAGDAPVAEDGEFHPVTPYGEKGMAEQGIPRSNESASARAGAMSVVNPAVSFHYDGTPELMTDRRRLTATA